MFCGFEVPKFETYPDTEMMVMIEKGSCNHMWTGHFWQ